MTKTTEVAKTPTGIGEHFPIGEDASLLYQVRDADEGDTITWITGEVTKANYAGVTVEDEYGHLTFVGAQFVIKGHAL